MNAFAATNVRNMAVVDGATTPAESVPKAVLTVTSPSERHWVGDGFPVYTMFSYQDDAAGRSPFLMLDYVAPTRFEPNAGRRRGVGGHPHRGFETVTIVYSGEVEHRDSTGAGGVIGSGDVQWMTAGAGILHEEFHSEAFSRTGGPFEMVQLWVNLPSRDKLTPAHYQSIEAARIPALELPGGAGWNRVIAGQYGADHGPARTYTPMNVWDVRIFAGKSADLPQPAGWTTLILVQQGSVMLNGRQVAAGQLVTLGRDGSGLDLVAQAEDVRLLLLAGQPIDEPVVGYGPFVMNDLREIRQAVEDFRQGRFAAHEARPGSLPS